MTNRNQPNDREEGAAMMVVMLTILMVTATAVFALHSTAFEVRATGFARQGHHTQYISESGAIAALAWVDFYGPETLVEAERRTEVLDSAGLDLTPFEPPLASGRSGYRLYEEDLELVTGLPPIDQDSVGGAQMAYFPVVVVDAYDSYVYTSVRPGERSDGGGHLQFLHATYTSRGRTRVTSGDTQTAAAFEYRPYNEGASDTRVSAVSGPFAR